jgi:EAL domain-containing protein (putative c-di-GMP-specific phosphodiesterase class I)
MVTAAEGVETLEQLEPVRAAGCKQAHGYLLSTPGPVSQLTLTRGKIITLRRARG